MNYCTNCGNQLNDESKYCSRCGTQVSQISNKNKIDEKFGKLNRNLSGIKKEISESKQVQNFGKKSDKVAYKVLRFFGYIGLIVLVLMILYPFVTGNQFVINSAYESNKAWVGQRNNYIGFFGEILIALYFPLFLIFIGFINNKILKTGVAFLSIGFGIYTVILFQSIPNKEFKQEGIPTSSMSSHENTIHGDSNINYSKFSGVYNSPYNDKGFSFGRVQINYINKEKFAFNIQVGNKDGCVGDIEGVANMNKIGNLEYSDKGCKSLNFQFKDNQVLVKETNCMYHGIRCYFDGVYIK
jgi:hypothetical protein